jgi:predicted metalloenzyme YecM
VGPADLLFHSPRHQTPKIPVESILTKAIISDQAFIRMKNPIVSENGLGQSKSNTGHPINKKIPNTGSEMVSSVLRSDQRDMIKRWKLEAERFQNASEQVEVGNSAPEKGSELT